MPQLPSGRHIALDATPLEAIVDRAYEGLAAHELMALVTVEQLFSHVNVLYFRTSEGGPTRALAAQSAALPEGLEPYPSGFSLSSMQPEVERWSPEDQVALKQFLNSERTHDFLAGLLEVVRNLQKELLQQPATPQGMLATWWKLGIHPLQDDESDETTNRLRSLITGRGGDAQ